VLDGFEKEYHPFTVQGKAEVFKESGRPEKVDGWYQVPGKIDKSSYGLLLFFVLTMGLLWLFNASI
jgi:SSS family solute:Na+ symporter